MTSFTAFTADDARLADAFLQDGFAIAPAEDRPALDRIRDFVAETAARKLGVPAPAGPAAGAFLDGIAERVEPKNLNDLRLSVIDALAGADWFRTAYFACGRRLLETLVGNELAMQRGLGLSIQLPNDESSVLPLHSDAWSEDSPFEVVLWVPLVDVYKTKSMFLLPPEADARWRAQMRSFGGDGVEALFRAVESEVRYLDIPYGNVLLFTHTLMHGNRVNREATARWSINIRFKGLFTPYSDKQLGDFFDPLGLRPASKIGLRYRLPEGLGDR
ncbi:MAG: hypothetical protein JO140_00905 [Candidatus Eremiobacteraeota bacterium]|nr:hypothetical protein [Candidatus Eremiobacteraeota bacterium]